MRPPLTGVVLAGGKSARMGRDKPSIEYRGIPLARRAAQSLAIVCEEVIVASGDGRRLDWLGLPQVADVKADAGPLAGMVAAIEAARSDLVAVLAVDMPGASAELFELLAGTWRGEEAVVPVTARGPEPLHAVYAKSAAPKLRRALEAGRLALREILPELDHRLVPESEWGAADPSGRFADNLNEPDDLNAPG